MKRFWWFVSIPSIYGAKAPPIPRWPLWSERFESIRDWERHLVRNGTVVMKFWLNVSRQEQHRRFRRRIDEPRSNWKFNGGDVEESERWDEYMHAYEEMLNHTATTAAPWYAIPADSKSYMRMVVSGLIRERLETLQLSYPSLPEDELQALRHYRSLTSPIKKSPRQSVGCLLG